MGRRPHIVPQVLILRLVEFLQRMQTAPISVLADQLVHLWILPKFCNTGCQHDQLSAICHGHTGTIDSLVSQPCAFEFTGIQIDHAFFQSLLYKIDIFLLRQLNCLGQAFASLPDKQAMGADAARRSSSHGQHEENGALAQEMLHRVVKQLAHRCVIPAHHPFHAVYCAHHVTFIDHVAAAHAYKQVFGMVGHTDDLMRHHLTRRDDQIVLFVHHPPIDLHADRLMPQPLRDILQITAWNLSHLQHVSAPVVGNQLFVGYVAEHGKGLFLCHWLMGTQCRHDVHLGPHVLKNMVVGVGDESGVGMIPRKIRWKDQHTSWMAVFQALPQRVRDLLLC